MTRAVAGDWRDFEDRLGALLRMSGGAVAPDCDTEIACGALLLPRAAAVSTRLRVRCVEDRSHLRVPRVDEGVDAVSYVGADDMREVAGGEQAHESSTSKAPPRGSWMTRLVSVPDRLARRHTNSAQTSVEEQSVACVFRLFSSNHKMDSTLAPHRRGLGRPACTCVTDITYSNTA